MKGIPQGRYTKEFREEAVKMVMDGGMSLPEAARRLSLPPSTLGNWVKAHKAGKRRVISTYPAKTISCFIVMLIGGNN